MKTALLGWRDTAGVPVGATRGSAMAEKARNSERKFFQQEQSAVISSVDARLWTLEEVAQFLGMSKAWVHDHATRRQPRIPCVRLGDRRAVLRFRRQDLIEFVERQAAAANDLFSRRRAGERRDA